jgi:peptidoglycan/xylan/chitin deacetylase (PgdA/CDA1 family)
MDNRVACITCDVEITSTKNVEEMESIVALLDRHNINCTFFIEIVHENIDLYPELLPIFKNHELGLHIHWGNMKSYTTGLEDINLEMMQCELENSLKLSKKLGFTPISFRGGGLCCTNTSLRLIMDYGFKIDSSVAAKLNEKDGWFQGHVNVPYKPWYYPSKQSYDASALSYENRLGILEVPVTRMIPSGMEWSPWMLTPCSPFFRFIVYEYILKSRWEAVNVITPIFHSWGEGKLRGIKFPLFLDKLEKSIKFLISKDFKGVTLKDLAVILHEI